MKIMITGANGFVGSSLCRYFYHTGHEVIASGRQANSNTNLLNYATYQPADITNPIELFNADVCIHAAGLASDTATYQNLYLNNVKGTENVLAAAMDCKYFIFISSSSVYDFKNKPAKETEANLNAGLSNYGKTKLQAEELVKANIPTHQKRLILRPRAIYGIGDRVLLPRILKLIKRNTVFMPINNAVQTSATHIKNLAYSIELFLDQKNKPDLQLFNIADAQTYLLKSLILKMIFAVEGRRLTILNIPPLLLKILVFINLKIKFTSPLSPIALNALTQNAVLDLTNIKIVLGYQPIFTFDNSCKQIGEWVNRLGGKKAYLNNLNDVPWMLNEH